MSGRASRRGSAAVNNWLLAREGSASCGSGGLRSARETGWSTGLDPDAVAVVG